MPTFRPGTVDASLWNEMGKEYPLVPKLKANDFVLDLGAHIGSFARYAFDQGSRNIYSFEADKENFDLAVENFREHTDPYYKAQPIGVKEQHGNFWNGAVVRSDERKDDALYFSGYLHDLPGVINTGGGNVFGNKGNGPAGNVGQRMQTFPLDEILALMLNDMDKTERAGTAIKVMKIDIEGSEWPVLYTSKHFSKRTVDMIVGEYHMPGSPAQEIAWRNEQGLTNQCNVFGLGGFLRSRGYVNVRIAAPYTHYVTPEGWRIGAFAAE